MPILIDHLNHAITAWEKLGQPALLERFVTRNGQPFTYTKRVGRKGAPKQCFANAATYVMRNRGVGAVYVEGFVMRQDIPHPFLHAWVTFNGTEAMDPTLT